jgi:hypothetical protein
MEHLSQKDGTEFSFDYMEYTSKKTGQVYFLNRMSTNRDSFLYFFSRNRNEERICKDIPDGYTIVESENGFPIMRKIKSGR